MSLSGVGAGVAPRSNCGLPSGPSQPSIAAAEVITSAAAMDGWLGPDGNPQLDRGATPAPTPDKLMDVTPRGGRGGNAVAQTYADGKPMEARYANAQFGLDWICYSSNWT